MVLNINEEDIEQFTEIDHVDGEAGLRLGMADLLSSTTVTEVRTDGNFINANGDLTRADSDAVCDRVGACLIPAYANINKHQQVVISPDSVEEANEAAKKQPGISSDGKPLTFTKTMILAHELGHAWRRSNNGALGFENAIRRRDKSNIRTRVAEQ
ncbi:MAG: hypothetical protein IPJ30_10060 [Acidobacteria bacterium]|nr:hypothetical protein [Acidobacteriota bacterium]